MTQSERIREMSYRSGDSDGDCTGGSSGSSGSSSESSDESEQSSQPAPASVKKQRRYTCDLCRARKVRLDCSLADSFDRTNAKNQKPRLQCLDRPSGKCTRPPRTSPPSAGPQQEDAGCCGWIIGTRGGVCVAPPPAPHQHPSSAPAPYLPRRRDISFPVIHTREPGTFLGVPMRHGRGA